MLSVKVDAASAESALKRSFGAVIACNGCAGVRGVVERRSRLRMQVVENSAVNLAQDGAAIRAGLRLP